MLSKSFSTYRIDLGAYAIQIDTGEGWSKETTLGALNSQSNAIKPSELAASSDSRLSPLALFPDFSFRSPTKYRLKNLTSDGVFLFGSERVADTDWHEYSSNDFRRISLRPVRDIGAANYTRYFSTPSLFYSIYNSLFIAAISTVITVLIAFGFAYALSRSCMRFKGIFRLIVMVPILVPSLLPGIALVYLFGNQGVLKGLLFGHSIYGPIGIVIGSVFFTLPHAFIIIHTALSISDSRLYEAAVSLRASKWKTFWTVTIPGARYGLISASFVVFNLVITDFGLPKVIGGQFNVLAVDIYKQVIGQQNFEMGAVVSVVLLVPALLAFTVDRIVQRRQVALLTARSVAYQPVPNKRFDTACLVYCVLVAIFVAGLAWHVPVCGPHQILAVQPQPVSHQLQFRCDGWRRLGVLLELHQTRPVDGGHRYLHHFHRCLYGRENEWLHGWTRSVSALCHDADGDTRHGPGPCLHLLFQRTIQSTQLHVRNAGNPGGLYRHPLLHRRAPDGAHAHTALKQMDPEFEAVSASLKQPVWRLFSRITVPVCLPAILDISIYMFVNAMTTVSAVVFLYSPDTTLASVAVLNMDDAGDIAPAAAMGMMIFYTNAAARIIHLILSRGVMKRTQAWRAR